MPSSSTFTTMRPVRVAATGTAAGVLFLPPADDAGAPPLRAARLAGRGRGRGTARPAAAFPRAAGTALRGEGVACRVLSPRTCLRMKSLRPPRSTPSPAMAREEGWTGMARPASRTAKRIRRIAIRGPRPIAQSVEEMYLTTVKAKLGQRDTWAATSFSSGAGMRASSP